MVVNGLFARLRPGKIRQMYQAIDTARQSDEYAEVGNRFDQSAHPVTLVVRHGELFPRVRLTLLHAERNPAPLLVNFEDHDFHLVTELYHLGRMNILIGPIHFGNVASTFNPLFNLHERAIIRQIRHLAEQPGSHRVAPAQAYPGIISELLEPERNPALLLIELENLGLDFVAYAKNFGRMLDPP